MQRISHAVTTKYPELKYTGLCHEINSMRIQLPDLMETAYENKTIKIIITVLCIIPLSSISFAGPTGQDLGDKWCSDVKMHFYAGGPEAGGFCRYSCGRCNECY